MFHQHKAGRLSIRDDFTDTNGVEIDAHTPNLANRDASWFITPVPNIAPPPADSLEIQDNQLSIDASNCAAIIDCGHADKVIEVDWTVGTGNSRCMILLRWGDASNVVYVRFREPNADVDLERVISGGYLNHGPATYNFVEGNTYRLKCIMVGNNVETFINDVSVHRGFYDHLAGNTSCGIGCVTIDNDQRFDNFRVSQPVRKKRNFAIATIPDDVRFARFNLPEPVRPFKFNGTDEAIYTTISVDGDVPTTRAFSLWFKANSVHEGVIAVICIPGTSNDGESNTKIQVHDNGKIQFKEESTPIKSDLTETGYYEPGIWYHVAGVEYANDSRSLFINGVEQYNDITARGYNGVATRFYVGCDNRTTNPDEGQFFDGEVQDVAFWHGELSQGIIQGLANGDPPEKYSPKYLINNLDNEVMEGGAITKLAGTESYAPRPNRILTQRRRTVIAPINEALPPLAKIR